MQPRARLLLLLLPLLVLALFAAWQLSGPSVVRLRVATTTSLYATGLLDALASDFEALHPGVRVEFIPVGSGEALRRAADGTVCVVLVHAPSLERVYIERGIITHHVIFAYNYFVIVGPRDDPADVREARSAVDAFRRIYEAGVEGRALFVSRGDNSGTHVRERMLWRLAGLDPEPGRCPWYLETGSGMAATLRVADEKRAYTLSDIGTFAKLRGDGAIHNLVILYTNSSELINVYSGYLVASCKGAERRVALEFLEYLASSRAQGLISRYGLDRYGVHLFYPAAGVEDKLSKAWEWLASVSLEPRR